MLCRENWGSKSLSKFVYHHKAGESGVRIWIQAYVHPTIADSS